ncbi:PE family protein [Mycobacterium intermedium]|uniref:PE family protein n=1 Tax=Mycobacterium intermedium TaxID=28445 RepID=A0A1E3SJ26_MYCIE|nr:PE family protein [Mycobacterium intermedium]MCV6963350.1 PE family protein [Mycobacterium intermedium]ODR01558.1 hypothetical protein BHQ20_08755 [Mycobacterium intermedium]OPE50276.1 PE family protein [Mycobacterium intermedium]ORA93394.1 PE family protein [Mycobacterium intermedium]
MSHVFAAPELLVDAAANLETIGSSLYEAHTLAANSTLAVLPAAADEVSTSIANLFSRYGQDYQRLAGLAAGFHEQFVQHLNASAAGYASAEAINVTLVQPFTSFLEASGLSGPLYDLGWSIFYQLEAVSRNNPYSSLFQALWALVFLFIGLPLLSLAIGVLLPQFFYYFGNSLILPGLVGLAALA